MPSHHHCPGNKKFQATEKMGRAILEMIGLLNVPAETIGGEIPKSDCCMLILASIWQEVPMSSLQLKTVVMDVPFFIISKHSVETKRMIIRL